MARVFEAVFNLYRVIPCYDQCHLFSVRADPCRISIKIVYSDVNSCCFHIDYDDYVSVVKSEDIIINVDKCENVFKDLLDDKKDWLRISEKFEDKYSFSIKLSEILVSIMSEIFEFYKKMECKTKVVLQGENIVTVKI